MIALKRRDDNCPIQVLIGCRKKLSDDKKVRFSVAPDGWSSSSSGEDDFVELIKRKRLLLPKKTSGRKHKKKCVSVGSENEGKSSKKGQCFAVANPETLEILARPYAPIDVMPHYPQYGTSMGKLGILNPIIPPGGGDFT